MSCRKRCCPRNRCCREEKRCCNEYCNHSNCECLDLVKLFDRMLVLTNDTNLGPNFVPPTPAELLAAVLDPNHQLMISSGLYTLAQVNAFTANAYAYLLARFGLDFSTGIVNPINGEVTLIVGSSVFILVPYTSTNATVIHVAFDSANVQRGINGKWYGYQFGVVIFVAAAAGVQTFPAGGQIYKQGDVLTVFNFDLLESNGNPPGPQYPRETIKFRSNYVSQNIINSNGFTDSLSKLEAIDSKGKLGSAIENIVFDRVDVGGDVITQTRVVVTFPELL